ncbi:MAG: hypothetical protein K6G33_08605 [Ruminococcus sp.]|uniref:hypothetical protein n=1 Tax=Ruminococcus sp. TaxID=41978 RepID=UPI0025DC4ACF|nr:hypothetical protein [Ruminococcus sp.]MCR5600783.1 hypothetical protein [Ruminococcus sp.]
MNNEKKCEKMRKLIGSVITYETFRILTRISKYALVELLKQGDMTINMSDHSNFEEIGETP